MNHEEIDALESTLSTKLPRAYRELLAGYPEDFLQNSDSEELLFSSSELIEEGTYWLYSAFLEDDEVELPEGCIAIGTNGAGDHYFLHPEHGDRVFIYLHEEDDFDVEADDLAAYLRHCRIVIHWWTLSETLTSDDPPALVAGLDLSDLFDDDVKSQVAFEASEVAERVLRFDQNQLPVNPDQASSRALQYLRNRLDPDFVVEPPFEDWELG